MFASTSFVYSDEEKAEAADSTMEAGTSEEAEMTEEEKKKKNKKEKGEDEEEPECE